MQSKPLPAERVVKALIVEDEVAMQAALHGHLRQLWPDLEIVGVAGDGETALHQFELHQPDIVFLDIQIPPPTGLEIARLICERCHVVFVTAFDEYALEAFDEGAADYILKPISLPRLVTTIQRLKKKLEREPGDVSALLAMLAKGLQGQVAQAAPRYLRWISATVGNSMRLITVDEIVYIQTEHKYLRIVLADSEVLVRKTLKELMDELDPEQFWQLHRSTIVNALEIANIAPNMAGRLTAQLKNRREQLPVSDTFARRFREM
jgi:DNA-binding LytR/AlgR family response regulator